MLKRWMSLLGLSLVLVACGVAVVTVTVTDLTPADGAEDVAVDVVLSATFDQAMDPDTLDGAFTLAADGGSDVAGTAVLSGDGLTATFTPDADLAFSTTYTATIAGTVATTGGATLDGDASWSFTTVAAPPPALTGNDYDTTIEVVDTPISLAADTSGGDGDVSFALDSGALPTGVTLDADTGAIAGTPTETGAFTGAVVASDDGGSTVTLNFDITVAELLEGGSYDTYTAASNIETAIAIDNPFTGGFGTLTYEVTAGALPDPFTTQTFDPAGGVYPDWDPAVSETYELALATDGSITGETGAVGTYTGTVTATDEIGQEATATFEIMLGYDLEYLGGYALTVPGAAAPTTVVVNGDKVRVNGVPTFALPATFEDLVFALSAFAGTGDSAEADFAINTSDGVISKVADTTADATWSYDVTVEGAVSSAAASDPVTFTFTYTAP